jgi:molecular chaperone GrpE
MADEIHNDSVQEDSDELIPEDGEGNTATGKDTVKDLREKLKKALAEKQEYLDGWQRTKADFVNARKRDEEARKELVAFANQDLIFEILPVLDSFSMAFANKDAWEKVDKNWRLGVEHIYSQLSSALERNGVTAFDPKGQKLDPFRHNAIATIPVTDSAQDHVILEVIQKGYTMNGKVLRPAQVKIGELQEK